jgi:hypothetical protein
MSHIENRKINNQNRKLIIDIESLLGLPVRYETTKVNVSKGYFPKYTHTGLFKVFNQNPKNDMDWILGIVTMEYGNHSVFTIEDIKSHIKDHIQEFRDYPEYSGLTEQHANYLELRISTKAKQLQQGKVMKV